MTGVCGPYDVWMLGCPAHHVHTWTHRVSYTINVFWRSGWLHFVVNPFCQQPKILYCNQLPLWYAAAARSLAPLYSQKVFYGWSSCHAWLPAPFLPSFGMSSLRCHCTLEVGSGLATSVYCMYLWLKLHKMWVTNGYLHHCCMNGNWYLRRWLLASNCFIYCYERCPKCIHFMYMEVCNFIAWALKYILGV